MLIEKGDTGEAVAKLHQILIEQGYDVGTDAADVFFGHDTFNAVTLFQGGHVDKDGRPLKVDGSVGDKTMWALEHPVGDEQHSFIAAPAMQKLPPGFTIAEAAVVAAASERAIGVKEIPNGSNRGERIDLYTGLVREPMTRNGPAWCAYFVSWCFAQNPSGKSPFGRIGNAQNIGIWARKRGLSLPAGTAAQRGDIGIIARDEVHGHTFIVEAANSGNVITLEGNSANRVARRERQTETISSLVRIKD